MKYFISLNFQRIRRMCLFKSFIYPTPRSTLWTIPSITSSPLLLIDQPHTTNSVSWNRLSLKLDCFKVLIQCISRKHCNVSYLIIICRQGIWWCCVCARACVCVCVVWEYNHNNRLINRVWEKNKVIHESLGKLYILFLRDNIS